MYALEPGKVEITVEELSPYPHSPLYPAVQAGRVVKKLFYHVIPEKQEPKFKLVSQVWLLSLFLGVEGSDSDMGLRVCEIKYEKLNKIIV